MWVLHGESARANASLLALATPLCLVVSFGLVVVSVVLVDSAFAAFVAGACVVSCAFLLWSIVTSKESQRLTSAADAELFTAQALRSPRLRLRGWKSINNVELAWKDLDHIAVGPGGVFAVETKWTTEDWSVVEGTFTNRWASEAVKQAKNSAFLATALLGHKAKVSHEVLPVLSIWGPGRPDLAAPVTIDGVIVLPGQLLRRTLAAQPKRVDSATIRTAVDGLSAYVNDKSEYDRRRLKAAR